MSKVYDSIHGFIHFSGLEKQLVDSFAFQRLHYIRQLGVAYLVYPGATHTRFEHSLGTMKLAGDIFDHIARKFSIPNASYWRKVLRVAALCHDLGHLPFSHVAEKVLLGVLGHELWTWKMIKSTELAFLGDEVDVHDVLKMAIGEKKLREIDPNAPPFSLWERVLAHVISGDFFGADRIDYLLRDAKCTGVAYGLFDYHQLIEMLTIVSYKDTLELGIEENGIESCEALLLARHFMHRRVYQYPSVKAYSFHMMRFMQKLQVPSTIEDYLAYHDSHVLQALTTAYRKGDVDAEALLVRDKRFRAIPLKNAIGEGLIEEAKRECFIPEDCIYVESRRMSSESAALHFPVVRSDQSVVDSSLCSHMHTLQQAAHFVYIAPQYEAPFHQFLKRCDAGG